MSTFRGALAATTALGLIVGAPLAARAETAAARDSYDLSEVVVTAQRRSERLQDVPLSVTALSTESLAKAGIVNSQELGSVTPGLFMIGGIGGTSQPTIRGVTSTLTGGENNVSIYIDGVYQPNNRNTHFDLPDVSSVEVLKGPQGTLFGRNATGGAILVTTRPPDLDAVKGMAYGSYGNYNSYIAKGFVSAPLVRDKLALSLAANYDHTDGWLHDLNQNRKRDGSMWSGLLRAKLRFIPFEGADFTVGGYFLTDENRMAPNKVVVNGNSAAVPKGIAIATQPYTFSQNYNGVNGHRDGEFSLHGDIEAGPGKFSTTTAYHHTVNYGRTDVDYTNDPSGGSNSAPIFTDSYEQEFLYTTHQLGRFHGVGGVFLYSYKQNSNLALTIGPTNLLSNNIDKSKSWAVFGEGTYDITDQLSVTGGLRYTSEERKGFATGIVVAKLPPLQFVGQHTWHSVTPRVSVLYKLTPHTNVYGTYSKGFTSGLFNTASLQKTPINPETVTAFEGGVKSNELRNLSLSVAGFHYNYKNQQQNQQQFDSRGAPFVVITNAAQSKIYGAEANANWRVNQAFDLTAGLSYIHARFSSYPGAQIVVPKLVNGVAVGGNQTITADISGFHMLRAPEWSGNVTAHYHIDAANGQYDLSANANYLGKVYWDFANRLTTPGYVLVSANATWAPVSQPNLKLGLWVKNLFDKVEFTDIRSSPNNDIGTDTRPRTFGMTVQYDY